MQTTVPRKLFALFMGCALSIGELSAIWSEPAVLNCYQANSFGNLVMDGNGNSLCTWQCIGSVQVGSLPANGSWTISTLANPGAGQTLSTPTLAMDQEGNALAVWRVTGANYSGTSLMYSLKPSGGSWSTPATLDQISYSWVNLGGVTFDADGNAIVGWFGFTGMSHTLYSSTLLKGSSSWEAPANINLLATLSCCGLQSDTFSNLFALSEKGDGSICLSVQLAGINQWSNPPIVLSQATPNVSPALAVSSQGVAAAVWINSENHSVYANSYSIHEGSQDPSQLTSDGNVHNNPALAFDSSGNAVAVWGNNKGALYWARMVHGQSSWSSPQLITPKLKPESAPLIKCDSSGRVFVFWLSTDPASYQVQMLTPSSTNWVSLGTALSTAHLNLESAAFVVSSTEAAVAVVTIEGELFAVENPTLVE